MDHQETVSQEAENTLSMIQDIRQEETPATETKEAESKPETVQEVKTEVVTDEADQEKELEARRNAIMREIAMDPGLTQQYAQRQTQQQVETDSPALPFDEFSFDPNNPTHMQALLDARLQEVGGPLFERINTIAEQMEQQKQAEQQQQLQQLAQQVNMKVVNLLDTYVPGFGGIADKLGKGESLTPVEKAVFNEAVNAESAAVQNVAVYLMQQNPGVEYGQAYSYVLHNAQLRAEIAQQIGPNLKDFSKAIGLVSQPKAQVTPEAKQQMKQEMYVESSNAVPAATAGSFEKALASGDELQMIRALRAT